MAKYTPTLLNQNSTPNLSPFLNAGFVKAGSDQLERAISANNQAQEKAKNKKFEQAKELRDGIVAGHFSDIMAEDVGKAIDELADLPTFSRDYAKKLAEVNANLGIQISKQKNITDQITNIEKAFNDDPSKKYYDNNALGARLNDQLKGGTYIDSFGQEVKITGTGIDSTNEDLNKAFQDFKNNTTNIKDGEIRVDFQKRLGEIINKKVSGGDLKNVNSEFAEFLETSEGEKFITGFGKYDENLGMYVPNFDENKLPPVGLVELYRGVDDASARLMAVDVERQRKAEGISEKDMTPVLRKTYEQKFLLNEMRKLAPGGGREVEVKRNIRNRPQDPTGGSGASREQLTRYNTVRDLVSNITSPLKINPNDYSTNNNVPFQTLNLGGKDLRVLDVSANTKVQGLNVARYVQTDGSGNDVVTYGEASKIYITIDPETKQKNLYFVGDDPEKPTVVNENNLNSYLQTIVKSNFGGGSAGQKYFDDFSYVSKQKGEMASDGSFFDFDAVDDTSDQVKSNEIELTGQAEDQGQAAPDFNIDDLNTNFATNSTPEIEKQLDVINKKFLDKPSVYDGLTDRNGKDLGPMKIIKVEREGNYFKNFINSYANVTYLDANDEEQTVQMDVRPLFEKISAGPGNFVIPVDEEK